MDEGPLALAAAAFPPAEIIVVGDEVVRVHIGRCDSLAQFGSVSLNARICFLNPYACEVGIYSFTSQGFDNQYTMQNCCPCVTNVSTTAVKSASTFTTTWITTRNTPFHPC